MVNRKYFLLFFITFSMMFKSNAQFGGNIVFVKTGDISEAHIGKAIAVDFKSNTEYIQVPQDLDPEPYLSLEDSGLFTLENGDSLLVIERRNYEIDMQFFSHQYLEVPSYSGSLNVAKIKKCILAAQNDEFIFIDGVIELFTKGGIKNKIWRKVVIDETLVATVNIHCSIPKKKINGVMLRYPY